MEKTWKPTTAGILNIVTGSMGIAGGALLLLASQMVGTFGRVDWSRWLGELPGRWGLGALDLAKVLPEVVGALPTALLIAGIVALVLGILALVGGIYAIRRIRWGFALAGSIIALFIGNILGILAIIFVSLGKNEFE